MNNGDKPAYPFKREGEGYYEGRVTSYEGLTKREYFAVMAMQGILSGRRPDAKLEIRDISEWSILLADELIKQLK